MLSRTTWRRALVLAITTIVACDIQSRTSLSGNEATRLDVFPKLLTLQQNQSADFTAIAFTSTGDTADLAVSWSATSGTIIDTSTNSGRHLGRYKAGADTGKVKIVAKGRSGGPADTSVVTVTLAPVTTVAVSPAAASVAVGQTVQLTATPKDVDGNALAERVVTWASTSPGVATVNGSGVVTGVAAGAATITAACEGQSGTAAITVTVVPVASVAVSPASATVRVGQTVQLAATPKDANGNPLTGRTVTWSTSNAAVAAVSGNGLVTSGAVGAATITASSEGQNGTATITVSLVPVASVVVTPPSASATVGQTVQLSVTTKDSAGNVLTGRTITWASSSTTVATVSAAGLVTAKAAGSVTITAASEGKSGTATVTVAIVPVASVAVSPAAPSIRIGTTVQLSATTKDSAGNVLTGRVVTWASSAPAVATVSASGLVTGVAAGTATLTATSEGKNGTATVTVTIVPVASVAVSPAAPSVAVGQTVQLTATTKDSAGNVLTGRVVTWASSAPAVATASASGLATGVAAGSATVTATSEGKNGTATVTVTAVPPPPPPPPPPPAPPGTVTNLTVAGVTESSVTLSFTEVTDGASQPANYDVRYMAGAMSWGAASSVTQGTCATPMVGSAIGATRTCTVLGLSSSTGYQFQLVAFRGTLNVDAVFGALSNVASGTTAASTAPVASVTVSPATASVAVAQTVQLAATLRDAAGNPLSGRVITWGSSSSGIASSNGTGLVTGVAVGSATITATSEGQSGTATIAVTVQPPPPAAGVVFESKWTTALGNTSTAVKDGGVWDQFADFGQGRILAVVSGGPAGYANALRVTQEGETGGAAYLQRNNFLTSGTDFYVRYYMRNDDINTGSYDHIVSAYFAPVPPVSLWYMMKGATGGGWGVDMASHGNGGDSDHYPVHAWQLRGPNNTSILQNGRWYRFEYWVHFVTATTMQFHVRIYDDANTLLYTDADMRQLDYGSATWNGSSTWTLESFYAAGYTMTIDPTKIIDFGMGNNAQAGTVNTGQYWYYAGVQIRTDTWPGP